MKNYFSFIFFEKFIWCLAKSFLKGLCKFNERDEIKVDFESCETSCPGIFAAGDVNNGRWKQIIIAAGEGARAALSVHKYLQSIK